MIMRKLFAYGVVFASALFPVARLTAQQPISSEIVNPAKVVKVGTSLNHLSVITLPEPVVNAAIGSDYVRMEYRGNVVLLEPLKAGITTDLFVWTAHSQTAYEVEAAGPQSDLSYSIDEHYPDPPPPPPGPSPSQAEIERDATYDPFMLSFRNLVPLRHSIFAHKEDIKVSLEQVAEDSHSYYIRIRVVN